MDRVRAVLRDDATAEGPSGLLGRVRQVEAQDVVGVERVAAGPVLLRLRDSGAVDLLTRDPADVARVQAWLDRSHA